MQMYTVEPLYSGHPWDKYNCPEYRGVLISGVNLYYKSQFGTFVSVLEGCPHFRVSSIEGFHCILHNYNKFMYMNLGIHIQKYLHS